ncbi:hypothetical protein D9M73_180500 [compost metagenome]
MLEDDQVAVTTDVRRERHLAAEAGVHRLARSGGDANALVELVGGRVAADHSALQRPRPPAQGDLGGRRHGPGLAGTAGATGGGGARGGFRTTETNGLADIHRIGRADAVVTRKLLEAPAMARGDRIQGIAALDLVGAGHDFVGRGTGAWGMRTACGHRQHYGDQNKPEKHTTSFSRRRH